MQQPAQVVVLLPTAHKELMVDMLLLVIREVAIAVKEGHHLVIWPQLEADPVTKLWLAPQQDEAVPIWSQQLIYVIIVLQLVIKKHLLLYHSHSGEDL